MKTSLLRVLLLSVVLALVPVALHAQATKIFVSATGNDASDGSRGSPKRTFQAAHDAVAAGGQIVVLDTAGYGPLNITKSVGVTVPPGVNGFVTVPLGTPAAITINAGTSAIVSLRGLIIEGGASKTTVSPNVNYGIFATSVRVLDVTDCVIRNFYDGLFFIPAGNADPRLSVFNTEVTNCRYGIDVETPNAFNVIGLIAGCRILNNTTGFYTGGPGFTFVTLKDSFLANNAPAIECVSSTRVFVGNCTFSDNRPLTVKASGTFVESFGNNVVVGDYASGDFTSIEPLR